MACSTLRSSAPGSQSSARTSPFPGYPELGLSFGAFMRVLYWRTFTARPDGARARRLLSLLRRLAVFAAARPAARAARAPLLPPAGLPSFSSPTLPPFWTGTSALGTPQSERTVFRRTPGLSSRFASKGSEAETQSTVALPVTRTIADVAES